MLLVQSFTARMPLLTATSAFGLGRRCWSSAQQCYWHCLRSCISWLATHSSKLMQTRAMDGYLHHRCRSAGVPSESNPSSSSEPAAEPCPPRAESSLQTADCEQTAECTGMDLQYTHSICVHTASVYTGSVCTHRIQAQICRQTKFFHWQTQW